MSSGSKRSSLTHCTYYTIDLEELDIKIATQHFKKLKHGDVIEVPRKYNNTFTYYYVYDITQPDSDGVLTQVRKLIRNTGDDTVVPLAITKHIPDAVAFYSILSDITTYSIELGPNDASVQAIIKNYDPILNDKNDKKITVDNIHSASYYSEEGTVTIVTAIKRLVKKGLLNRRKKEIQLISQQFHIAMYRSSSKSKSKSKS